jgi:hypothetical protein
MKKDLAKGCLFKTLDKESFMKKLIFTLCLILMLCPVISVAESDQPTDNLPLLESTFNVAGQDTEPSRNRELIKDGVIPLENPDPRAADWRISTVVDPGTGNVVSVPVPRAPERPPAPAKVQKP